MDYRWHCGSAFLTTVIQATEHQRGHCVQGYTNSAYAWAIGQANSVSKDQGLRLGYWTSNSGSLKLLMLPIAVNYIDLNDEFSSKTTAYAWAIGQAILDHGN